MDDAKTKIIEDLNKEIAHLKQTISSLKSNSNSDIKDKEYRLLFEHLSSGFSYHDVIFNNNGTPIDCRYIEVNKAFEDILGFKREDVIGKTFIEIQKGQLEDFWMKIYGKVSRTGKSERFEQYSSLIGKYLEVIAYSPQHGKFVTIFNDITHKKLYEKRLRKQALINKTLASISRELISSSPSIQSIASYILENSTNITECNYGLITLYDEETDDNTIYAYYDIEADKSFNKMKLKSESNSENFNGICNNNLNNKNSQFENKNCFIKLDCETQLIDLKINNFLTVPIYIETKLIGQIILANSKRDITSEDIDNIEQVADIFALAAYRFQTENELKIAKQRAEESDRLKTTFLENMSHEIRTPMNGIIGFAELLKDTELAHEQKVEYISYINNSCSILTNIIDDIIDISKIEAGQLQIFKQTFLLTPLMNEIKEQFNEESARQNKEDVVIKLLDSNNKNLLINTDNTRLTQVFYNLLSNALKFTKEGKIEFGYNLVNENSIRFFVKDTGIGIPKHKQKVIFERFRQADESQHRNFGGAGLGLAISKNLVELLGGKIWFESEVAKGSSFYFEIPYIVENTKANSKRDFAQIDIPNWNSKKLLIVEDNNINFILIKEIISKTNAQITWAEDGKKAIKLYKENTYDLVLMDIMLPDMNGYEVFAKIRKINNQTPIVAQTAQAMVEEQRKINKAGFAAYISKPIKKEIIFETLRQFL